MAIEPTVNVETRLAWWWHWYATGLILFCQIFRTIPNLERVGRMTARAIRVPIDGGPWRRLP